MGTDKAGLTHRNGLPFWQHQLHTLEQTDPDYIMVSAPQEPEWISEEMIWVKDVEEGMGPVRGILSALTACSTSHLICLGIDVVEMQPQELSYFRTCCTQGVGLIPQTGKGWEPLCAVYPREAIAIFKDSIRRQEYSLQTILEHLQQNGMIRPYPVPDHEIGLYQNINTDEEYAAWMASGQAG